MISTREVLPFTDEHKNLLTSMAIDPSDVLFFDIETTGFKAGTSRVYLIGAAVLGNDGWILNQWMTESAGEEVALIRTFHAFLRPYHTLLHFNGTRFDIPYMEEKLDKIGLTSPFRQMHSVDLYKIIFPFRTLLRLKHLNQKALEEACGLHRKDLYSGGELIDVYRDFEKEHTPDQKAEQKKMLLLHNIEDIKGMLYLLPLCTYYLLKRAVANDLAGCVFHYDYKKPSPETSPAANDLFYTTSSMQFDLIFPWRFPISCSTKTLKLSGSTLRLTVPVIHETLKYYFDDPKSYYYLPEEDMAIHKSVAAFVDKKYRKQATKQTCYIKKSGSFIPQPQEVFSPCFKHDCVEKETWYLYPDNFIEDEALQREYLKRYLSNI